jgi:hypothetical protein
MIIFTLPLRTPDVKMPKNPWLKQIQTAFNPDIIKKTEPQVDVMRIEQTQEYTRIDFVHYAYPNFINGGWVHIMPQTFIRSVDRSIILPMVEAINIPVAPNRHLYKNTRE